MNDDSLPRHSPRLGRRDLLKAAAGLALAGPAAAANALQGEPWMKPVLDYLESRARPDGGYGWGDQPDSHLTPTFAVVGCYHVLGKEPPRRAALAHFLRTHHPIRREHAETKGHAADLRGFVYEQVQGLRWLREDASEFAAEVRGWVKPSRYPLMYEPTGIPIFRLEMMAFFAREALGLPVDDLSPELIAYLDSRRRANGSFNNTPVSDGSDGHLLNTWWGLAALRLLGRLDERREAASAWVQACQLPNGGFTWQPGAAVGGVDDVLYTWAGVKALAERPPQPPEPGGSQRSHRPPGPGGTESPPGLGGWGGRAGWGGREPCIRYLLSLWNADGGFGDRPGLPSSPEATYRALDALKTLGALDRLERAPRRQRPSPARIPDGLHPFTIQLEAPGAGSPVEAAELARALGIHLWGAKNAQPEWVARTQEVARQRGVPVTFFVANEEYGTWVSFPGQGTYSHLSDPIAQAGSDFGASLANRQPVPDWETFRRERIGPLARAGGRMVWQICDNEELSRILLDDSVERGGGYAALSAFHFNGQNFADTLPFHWRYRHQIPFVSLQDAHGAESWWWADELAGYRTLFLAEAPTWEAWLAALERNWVVAVRHDAVTQYRTRILGGAPGVQEYVRARETVWRWWGDRPAELRRPAVSLVAVAPGDPFEADAPEEGIILRVRCWWRTRSNILREPAAELLRLTLDGREVIPERREEKGGRGQLLEHCHVYHVAAPAPGRHEAAATVRLLDTGAEVTRGVSFTVG